MATEGRRRSRATAREQATREQDARAPDGLEGRRVILVAGVILVLLLAWGVRVVVRRMRKKACARAQAKARAAALAMEAPDVAEDPHALPHRSLPAG